MAKNCRIIHGDSAAPTYPVQIGLDAVCGIRRLTSLAGSSSNLRASSRQVSTNARQCRRQPNMGPGERQGNIVNAIQPSFIHPDKPDISTRPVCQSSLYLKGKRFPPSFDPRISVRDPNRPRFTVKDNKTPRSCIAPRPPSQVQR